MFRGIYFCVNLFKHPSNCQRVFLPADPFECACAVVYEELRDDWARLYRALPWHPPRSDLTREREIDEFAASAPRIGSKVRNAGFTPGVIHIERHSHRASFTASTIHTWRYSQHPNWSFINESPVENGQITRIKYKTPYFTLPYFTVQNPVSWN